MTEDLRMLLIMLAIVLVALELERLVHANA